MTVQVGNLSRKRIVKNSRGDIIDWSDESMGGDIIRKGRIVNQEAWDAYQKKLADERDAAKAASLQRRDVDIPERNVSPVQNAKVAELEKKVAGMDEKMDKILNLLSKNG